MSSNSSDNGQNGREITEQTSKRMCSHMNKDHACSVYAMALDALPLAKGNMGISNATLQSVSLEGYTLSFVVCSGDLCEKLTTEVKFRPPLRSESEARSRLIKEHHRVMSPKLSWIYGDLPSLVAFTLTILITYWTFILGTDGLIAQIESNKFTADIIQTIFGTSSNFAIVVKSSCYFAWVAHTLEALWAIYLCTAVLKFPLFTLSLQWFIFVSFSGYFVMRKLLKFVEIKKKSDKGKTT